jgi:hypothetical protein
MTTPQLNRIGKVIGQAKSAAKKYRGLTGKPLGITGEVAEFEAARLLGLELSEARQPGYDAIRVTGHKPDRIQIKGRRIPKDAKKSQRLGSIRFNHPWDFVVLVILDDDFEPVEIHEAGRRAIRSALKKPGSKARNVRGALTVSKFKAIGRCLWSRDTADAG